ncbi:helix-turn-helix domain-containing protein [Sphingomonas sp. MMSM20]|uniref:helix-turn-helix domain-containing protein n=1 Tax=Sphingomonas lycopersici TaxID=2951807 RepID=UPI0022373BDD|nr:helix-turn-helix domain-containing protein [Sphingomonas lycopersici]MCW6532511.1 helix-turn-helix domain-containing protein [Sphingomonas lycopersici]
MEFTRESPFLSNEEAAAFLRLSPRTLEKYRVIGGGPRFRKFGRRVFYAGADLVAWAAQRVCDSTSEAAWRAVSRRS